MLEHPDMTFGGDREWCGVNLSISNRDMNLLHWNIYVQAFASPVGSTLYKLYIYEFIYIFTTVALLPHADALPGHRSLLVPTPQWPVEPRLPWRAAGPHRPMPGCHWWWRSSPCLSPCCWHLSGGILAAEERRLPAAPFSGRLCPFYWWGDDAPRSAFILLHVLTITLFFFFFFES